MGGSIKVNAVSKVFSAFLMDDTAKGVLTQFKDLLA